MNTQTKTNFVDLTAPAEQSEGTKARLARWLKKVGDAVKEHEPVAELETDKVAMEVTAPADGVLAETLVAEGVDVTPGMVLGRIALGVAMAAPPSAVAQPSEPPKTVTDERAPRLSPLVKRLLKLHHVEAAAITGTGLGGRIRRDDVIAYVQARDTAKPAPAAVPLPRSEGTTWVAHDTMRRRIAEHMVESLLHTAPHVTSIFEADLSRIMAHREAHKAAFAKKGVKLTLTAYFVAASVKAIAAVPQVNSRFHQDGLEIFHDANIGIGTALGDKGLIVPVIKGAQGLNLYGIAERLHALTEKARTGKLTPEDVRGGTFTISNHGVSGSLVATPIIINQPQSAILGVGKVEKRVCVVNVGGHDSIQIRPKAFVTLTIDHRVLDGFQTNAFLTKLIEVIENWPQDGN
ncbi:MAG: 2-oxo acid dehydrogenase subunit E2 [Sphingomonadales bacterium]|nr:2-oxo acid dehydrogenase subunit E2 [Sphingomonadales bacterium]